MKAEHPSGDPRADARRLWLDGHFGDTGYELTPASEDASFRRYFRVVRGQTSLILMDAPPEHEDSAPFVHVAGLLAQADINAPRILTSDLTRGFLLLSDFGNTLYLDALSDDSADELYRAAIDGLIRMQSRIDPGSVPPYDERLLMAEMRLFRDWLLERHLEMRCDRSVDSLLDRCFDLLARNALEQPQVFVHRDYHSRNLMLTGPKTPGVLDFQDAVCGPITYDLVSLLRDCYIKWPLTAVEEWLGYYAEHARAQGVLKGIKDGELRRWFDLMGVQRHLKASGIFARLGHRDGKMHFIDDVPRTLSYIVDVASSYPEIEELGGFVQARILDRWTR